MQRHELPVTPSCLPAHGHGAKPAVEVMADRYSLVKVHRAAPLHDAALSPATSARAHFVTPARLLFVCVVWRFLFMVFPLVAAPGIAESLLGSRPFGHTPDNSDCAPSGAAVSVGKGGHNSSTS